MRVRPGPVLFAMCAALALPACGGSSSETPWPAEPLNLRLGPRGERLPGTNAADVGRPLDVNAPPVDDEYDEPDAGSDGGTAESEPE